ncbi:aldo/keto reductase [Plantibacter flavus]|uniref:aldo/keto reductase n=1 Tax=Plantibacter TaxID=190323 RepID=UPI0010C15DEE|nr:MULTISPECIES: aldo/keto reductase [Plantibacter]MBD8103891.1 aldo/keto reductase [Plantibacter sp. CFBP 8775]MBD8467339.1 aldo/keto reductase [Plantibacter sp. CFBP 8798]TKJ97035.1 aldo/keto reductase [Plantibacter flavus]
MRTRQLRGLKVTEIGFGAAQLGNLFRPTTDEEAKEAVDTAWKSGIRYFDTAPHYGLGLSEQRLGEYLRSRPRDQFVISTKVGRRLVPTPERAAAGDFDLEDGFAVPATHRREWDFSRDGVLRSIESSLSRLHMDRLDIVYLHDPDDHWDSASTTGLDALIELRDQGVVGAVGAGMNQAPMLARLVRERDVDVVMVAGRYTLLDRSAEDELLAAAAERGVAIVAAGVYNSGLLSQPQVPADATYDYQQAPSEILRRARALSAACSEVGVTLPQAAVQFPLLQPNVASVVVGMRTAEQVEGTVTYYDSTISPEAWRHLGVTS